MWLRGDRLTQTFLVGNLLGVTKNKRWAGFRDIRHRDRGAPGGSKCDCSHFRPFRDIRVKKTQAQLQTIHLNPLEQNYGKQDKRLS